MEFWLIFALNVSVYICLYLIVWLRKRIDKLETEIEFLRGHIWQQGMMAYGMEDKRKRKPENPERSED